jgi:hypothetical protein
MREAKETTIDYVVKPVSFDTAWAVTRSVLSFNQRVEQDLKKAVASVIAFIQTVNALNWDEDQINGYALADFQIPGILNSVIAPREITLDGSRAYEDVSAHRNWVETIKPDTCYGGKIPNTPAGLQEMFDTINSLTRNVNFGVFQPVTRSSATYQEVANRFINVVTGKTELQNGKDEIPVLVSSFPRKPNMSREYDEELIREAIQTISRGLIVSRS